MHPLNVSLENRFTSTSPAAVLTYLTITVGLLVYFLDVRLQEVLVLQKLPTEMAGHGVEVAGVTLHHVSLQRLIGIEGLPTIRANKFLHFKLINDLQKFRVTPLVRMEAQQMSPN